MNLELNFIQNYELSLLFFFFLRRIQCVFGAVREQRHCVC